MVDFLKSWIMNVVVIVVVISIIEVILPEKRFKKFINVISGFIILIAIAKPLFGFLNNSIDIKTLQLANSNKVEKMVIQEDTKVLKDRQMKQVVSLYKKKLENQIKEDTMKIKGIADAGVQLKINEDYNSKSFGDIFKVCISISKKTKEEALKTVVKIDKVDINNKAGNSTLSSTNNTGTTKEIQDMLKNTFSIQSEKIEISYR